MGEVNLAAAGNTQVSSFDKLRNRSFDKLRARVSLAELVWARSVPFDRLREQCLPLAELVEAPASPPA
jgi:hypothetical protein